MEDDPLLAKAEIIIADRKKHSDSHGAAARQTRTNAIILGVVPGIQMVRKFFWESCFCDRRIRMFML